MSGVLWRLALAAGMAMLLGLLALAVVALFVRIDFGTLLARLSDPAVVDALRLSLVTSAAALIIVVVAGTPAAWLLATRNFPGIWNEARAV